MLPKPWRNDVFNNGGPLTLGPLGGWPTHFKLRSYAYGTFLKMFGIAWVETTRDGTKIGFLFRFVYPFFTIIGRGAQSMIGGGSSGTPRYKVTPLQVTPHVIRF